MMDTKYKVFGWCLFKCVVFDYRLDTSKEGMCTMHYITTIVKGYDYCFLYWKNMISDFVSSQVLSLKRLFYSAGFIHKWHAFHWKRCSKIKRY